MSKFCGKCGTELDAEDVYCSKCGFNLKKADTKAETGGIELKKSKSGMLKCENCGMENEEGTIFCKNCGKTIEIRYPLEELSFLKSEFRFFKDNLKKESNYFKDELKASKEKINVLADKLNEKKENYIGTKIASILVLLIGINNITAGSIIIGSGKMLNGILNMLSGVLPIIGEIGSPIQTVNIITDTMESVGMFFMALGIASILLPYYLWQGNKVAAFIAMAVLTTDIIATFYQLKILLDFFPKDMTDGLVMMIIPQIIIAAFPVILIYSELDDLK